MPFDVTALSVSIGIVLDADLETDLEDDLETDLEDDLRDGDLRVTDLDDIYYK